MEKATTLKTKKIRNSIEKERRKRIPRREDQRMG